MNSKSEFKGEPWIKGLAVLDLSFEKNQIPTCAISMYRARKNKFTASAIANKAIIRCIYGL